MVIRSAISAEARGRVRELAASLDLSSARMAAALERVPAKVRNSANWKGKIGTERAVAKIVSAIPIPPELSCPSKAVWRYLQPVEQLPAADAEAPPRSGFIVMAIIAGNKNRLVRAETFGCGYTTHAICRLLDRSCFRVDPAVAMLEAHAALTWLDPADGSQVFDLRNAQLPAAGGAFLVSPGRFGPDGAPLAIARTWLSNDQLFPDQASTSAAWRELIAQPGGAA